MKVLDGTGKQIHEYRYGPYGNLEFSKGSSDNRFIFTGKEWDAESGLFYFGARYYDPSIGRWISKDPMDQFFSEYSYVGNDPLHSVDPWGLKSSDDDDRLYENDPYTWEDNGDGTSSKVPNASDNTSFKSSSVEVKNESGSIDYLDVAKRLGIYTVNAFKDAALDAIKSSVISALKANSDKILSAIQEGADRGADSYGATMMVGGDAIWGVNLGVNFQYFKNENKWRMFFVMDVSVGWAMEGGVSVTGNYMWHTNGAANADSKDYPGMAFFVASDNYNASRGIRTDDKGGRWLQIEGGPGLGVGKTTIKSGLSFCGDLENSKLGNALIKTQLWKNITTQTKAGDPALIMTGPWLMKYMGL